MPTQGGNSLTCRCFKHAIVIIALLPSFSAGAQVVAERGNSIDAFQVDEALVIDGQLDDDARVFSTPIKNLHRHDLQNYLHISIPGDKICRTSSIRQSY